MASLRSKVEAALVAALDGVTNNIYSGMGSEDKVLPCVIARAVSAEDADPNGGRYLVTCEITTKATAGHDSDFDDTCEAVKDITDAAGFIASLETADLFVYGFSGPSRVEWATDGDSWTETRTIQIECAPKA